MEQEELGYALGLTVPKEDLHLFGKARTGKMPTSGWGTQIQNPEFEINKILRNLDIPLYVEVDTKIKSENVLRDKLESVQADDGDALLCFDYGKLWDVESSGGHVCVFHGLENGDVWMIDPECNVPKHRKVTISKLSEAINIHGPENMCGIWKITQVS